MNTTTLQDRSKKSAFFKKRLKATPCLLYFKKIQTKPNQNSKKKKRSKTHSQPPLCPFWSLQVASSVPSRVGFPWAMPVKEKELCFWRPSCGRPGHRLRTFLVVLRSFYRPALEVGVFFVETDGEGSMLFWNSGDLGFLRRQGRSRSGFFLLRPRRSLLNCEATAYLLLRPFLEEGTLSQPVFCRALYRFVDPMHINSKQIKQTVIPFDSKDPTESYWWATVWWIFIQMPWFQEWLMPGCATLQLLWGQSWKGPGDFPDLIGI